MRTQKLSRNIATRVELSVRHNGHEHNPVVLLDDKNTASIHLRGEERLDVDVELVGISSLGPRLYLRLQSEVGKDKLSFSSLVEDKSKFDLKSEKQSMVIKVSAGSVAD